MEVSLPSTPPPSNDRPAQSCRYHVERPPQHCRLQVHKRSVWPAVACDVWICFDCLLVTIGWIGFEDSASEGGFIWSDGTNINYVNWSPGEVSAHVIYRCMWCVGLGLRLTDCLWFQPNGAVGDQSSVDESAVAISFRNWRQTGEWNDETRNGINAGTWGWNCTHSIDQRQQPQLMELF